MSKTKKPMSKSKKLVSDVAAMGGDADSQHGSPKKAATASIPVTVYGRLQPVNKWLAVGYAVQALLLLVLATGKTFPIVVSFLGVDSLASQSNGMTVYASAVQHLFDMPLAQLLGLSLGISAAFHALEAFFIRPPYEEMLAKQQNPYRWLEQSFSTTLLTMAVALAVGVRDVVSLVIVFVLGFITHLLGWQFERHIATKQRDDAHRSFIMMTITGGAIVLSIAAYIAAGIVVGNGIPFLAGLAYGVGLAGVLGFGWVLLQRKQGKTRWMDFVFTEKVGILLSFVIKSSVAWLILVAVR